MKHKNYCTNKLTPCFHRLWLLAYTSLACIGLSKTYAASVTPATIARVTHRHTCVATLEEHIGRVSSIFWCAGSNTLLASGDQDNSIRLWSPCTYECTAVLDGHVGAINSIDGSSNGILASGSQDGIICLWDPSSQDRMAVFEGNTNAVSCVAWYTNATLAAAAGNGVYLWDVNSETCVRVLNGHKGDVYSLDWGIEAIFVSGGRDKDLLVWDPRTPRFVAKLKGHKDIVSDVACSSQGVFASASWDKTVRLWDMKMTNSQVLYKHKKDVLDIEWSCDGRLLASGSRDRTVKIWDMHENRVITSLPRQGNRIRALAWSPEGMLAVSAKVEAYTNKLGNMISIWDLGLT